MANLSELREFPDDKIKSGIEKQASELFVALLPELYYAVNKVLEDCTPTFSKKVGVALWALDASKKADNVGAYLTTSDLVGTFRSWFVVSENNASPEVSKVKNSMFDLGLIKTEGGADHIHLTEKGEEALRLIKAQANTVLGIALSALRPGEQLALLEFAKRMIESRKKRDGDNSIQLDLPSI
jgi:hypothetical protein